MSRGQNCSSSTLYIKKWAKSNGSPSGRSIRPISLILFLLMKGIWTQICHQSSKFTQLTPYSSQTQISLNSWFFRTFSSLKHQYFRFLWMDSVINGLRTLSGSSSFTWDVYRSNQLSLKVISGNSTWVLVFSKLFSSLTHQYLKFLWMDRVI